MIEITSLDGKREGMFHHGETSCTFPGLLTFRKDSVSWGSLSIEKPLSYPFRSHLHGTGLSVTPLFRVYPGTPPGVARRLQEANASLREGGDVTTVFLSGYDDIDTAFVRSLNKSKLFLFDLQEERAFLRHFFMLRKRYPNAVSFVNCPPETVPVLAYAGVDLFPDTSQHRAELASFLEDPTPHYVEMRACASLCAKRLLDLLYLEFWGEHEAYVATPDDQELFISSDSFWRPTVRRWEREVSTNYVPPSNVCVLLPCSARKPYSSSQSHKTFIASMRRTLRSRYPSLTQLIVTSPYGVVPRELETLIDYDTVVTGRWSLDEVERSRTMVRTVLEKMDDPFVIAHLPENEQAILDGLPCDVKVTCDGHPLSPPSMRALEDTLRGVADRIDAPAKSHPHMRTLSRFLYGTDVFGEDIRIKGRGVKQVFEGSSCVASFDKTIRPFSTHAPVRRRWVSMMDFALKGDLFCVGIEDADDDIRPGDEVVIMRNGRMVASGKALLPGHMMARMHRGKAVKVKKRCG